MKLIKYGQIKFLLTFIITSLLCLNLIAQTEEFEPADGMTIGQNFIAFEAEATNSPLKKWKIITPGDSRYKDNSSVPPIGETHLEFTGNNPSVGDPNSPLEYRFVCPKTGEYRLGARLFQRLEGLPEDKCNDVYIRMEGNFTSAGEIPTYQLKRDTKFYGRGVNKWGALYNLESHSHGHAPALYNLIEGEIYTLTVSGRAQRTNIDYWLLYETSLPITLKAHQDLAAVNNEKYRPVIYGCQTFDAIEMKYTGIEGFTNAKTDNKAGLDILQIPDRLEWAAAQMVFEGTDGVAKFTLNTMLETDGESTYRVKINGELIGEVTNNRIHGTEIDDYTIQSHQVNEVEVLLQNKDTIQIEFNNATNGLVPEGDLTATSRGRWLNLEICTTGSFAEYSISLNHKSATLMLGDSLKLDVQKVLPFGTDSMLVWSSENEEVVTVGDSEIMKAKSVGTTTINVSTLNGKYTAQCNVVVVQSLPYANEAISIPGLFEAEDFDQGGEGRAYHDNDIANTGYSYRSMESVDIIKNDEGEYIIIAVEEGEWLRYTLDVKQSGNYFIQADVSAIQENSQFFFELKDNQYIVAIEGAGEEQIFRTVRLENVELEKGIFPMELGFETDGIQINWIGIFETGTTFDVSGVSLDIQRLIMDAGEAKQLKAAILPVNADDQSVLWTSSDESVVQVTEDGMVQAQNEGSAFIKVTTNDGNFADSAYVKVNGNNGIEELENRTLVYPVPFTQELQIAHNLNVPFNLFQLYDLNGKVVYKQILEAEKQIISPSYHLVPRGFYIVELISNDEVKRSLIVRQ